MAVAKLTYHAPGFVRLKMHPDARHFGQIKRSPGKWHAEIRHSATGDLVRFAGVWKKFRDARDEIERLLSKPEHR